MRVTFATFHCHSILMPTRTLAFPAACAAPQKLPIAPVSSVLIAFPFDRTELDRSHCWIKVCPAFAVKFQPQDFRAPMSLRQPGIDTALDIADLGEPLV